MGTSRKRVDIYLLGRGIANGISRMTGGPMMFRAATAALLLVVATSISAATFTVTSPAASGSGTLSQALLDANANPGLDQIRFTVATAAIPATGLPESTDPVDIDGLVGGGKVMISMPVEADVSAGFKFAFGSSGSSLRNVSMAAVPNLAARVLPGLSGVTIEGNVFRSPVVVDGNETVIQDNLFADFPAELRISGDFNDVVGNTVRVVRLLGIAELNEIGRVGDGNTITTLTTIGTQNTIMGNTFPGSPGGVAITGSTFINAQTLIGENTITGYATGVRISAGTGFTITNNTISSTGLPIDLGGDGPTANDPAPDADSGANSLQNFPVLTSATLTASSLVVNGTLASAPLSPFLIQLFSNGALVASFDVFTDAAGNATFTRTIDSPLPGADEVITATATHAINGDTSEVSAAVAIEAPGQLALSSATYNVHESEGSITVVVNRSGGSEGTVTVQFATQNGTAASPSDFAATGGTLTFGPGVTTQSFVVPIVSDAVPEAEETFTVTLSAPGGGATLGAATATVIIAAHLPPIPTASTWMLLLLASALAVAALSRC